MGHSKLWRSVTSGVLRWERPCLSMRGRLAEPGVKDPLLAELRVD